MLASAESCLSTEHIRHLLAGENGPFEFEQALDHIDHCGACRAIAEDLPPEDVSVVSIGDPSASVDTACEVAIMRLVSENPPTPSGIAGPPTGFRHIGAYRILEAVGQGGMGWVYLAEHERLRRRCAIKFLPQNRLREAGWLDRFEREMAVVASLEHPNIVRANDAGQEGDWHFLVMEYLDGLDAGKLASRNEKLTIADACEIVRQAALGLSHIHQAGLVHRDIKPSNLMVTRSGVVKVCDLGLVLAGDDPLAIDERVTTIGHLIGTMPYMSPEQLMDSRNVTPAADVYSLGATWYRLIAGRTPHGRNRGLAAHVTAITNEEPQRIDQLVSGLPFDLSSLLMKMLAHDPAERPDLEQVAETLDRFAKASRLKHLVRHSLQLADEDESSRASDAVLTAGQTVGQTPKRRPPRWPVWIATLLFVAGMVWAGVTFVLQTERGELIVESESEGVSVVVKQGDQMVERLQVQQGDGNRFVLRQGTYLVEIEGSENDIRLSRNRVVIEPRKSSAISLHRADDGTSRVAAAPERLAIDSSPIYKGKPFDHWMDLLRREESMESLGDAIRGVERLSREDPERRQLAASETLKRARQLGGMVSSGYRDGRISPDPANASKEFMGILLAEYPHYFPMPGLAPISVELHQGNRRSRMAGTWLLHNFLQGVVSDAEQPGKRNEATQFLEAVARDKRLTVILESLLSGLGKIDKPIPEGDSQFEAWRSTAFGVATQLAGKLDQENDADDWIVDHVCQRVERAVEHFEKHSTEESWPDFNAWTNWFLEDGLYFAALELHREGRLALPAEFAAANAACPLRLPLATDIITRLDKFVEVYPNETDSLRAALLQWIEFLIQYRPDSGGIGGTFGVDPASLFRGAESVPFWERAFDVLANAETNQLKMASVLRLLGNNGSWAGNVLIPDELREPLKAAIEKLANGKE